MMIRNCEGTAVRPQHLLGNMNCACEYLFDFNETNEPKVLHLARSDTLLKPACLFPQLDEDDHARSRTRRRPSALRTARCSPAGRSRSCGSKQIAARPSESILDTVPMLQTALTPSNCWLTHRSQCSLRGRPPARAARGRSAPRAHVV